MKCAAGAALAPFVASISHVGGHYKKQWRRQVPTPAWCSPSLPQRTVNRWQRTLLPASQWILLIIPAGIVLSVKQRQADSGMGCS
jgi:hypothetical protein